MSNTLLSAVTPLRPTVAQTVRLRSLMSAGEGLHSAVRLWLRAVGDGQCLPLRQALSAVAEGGSLPSVRDETFVHVPRSAHAELGESTSASLPRPWRDLLPDETFTTMLSIEARRLQRFDSPAPAGRVSPLWPLPRLPLDLAVRPLDAYHIVMDGSADPIVADLWALPDDLSVALLAQAGTHAREVESRRADLMACIQGGDLGMATELYRLAHLRPSAHEDRLAGHRPDRSRPHRVDHASLVRTTDIAGRERFQIEWTLRIPHGYLPKADIDDTLGIDLGYRRLATAASAEGRWTVERRVDVREGLPEPAAHLLAELLAHAQVRRMLLDLHRTDIEALVRRALRFRQVNLERLDWPGLIAHGDVPWCPEAMALLGAPSITDWISLLAPVSGTRVELVDPSNTSTTCHRCGGRGLRPRPYTEFVCPSCGPMDADLSGALAIRRGDVASWAN
ncbi:zinc ribbon domain-containing protein [Deinococcus alpinitundrae]|uniref:zinc ribbon domain-containing protein n=1 Tax=Deinococcus alpinitundrae TaxID=468913 RepID=UPI0013795C57|nr:zinc ribbon domain-containing protein [Deinococcus alpinitundrae]